jgi:nucleoid-associated protein YgaU
MPVAAGLAAAEAPSFDIVRVGRNGDAVVAGRAAAGASVALLDNGAVIARTRADASGQWVVIPAAPLPAGGQELALTAKSDGAPETAGRAPVVLVVPDRSAAPAPRAVAVLLPPDAAPRMLQRAEPEQAGTPDTLGLDVVDYDDHGSIRFAGRGIPDSFVQLYVDDASIGGAGVDRRGHWGIAPVTPVAAGDHRLRLDDLSRDGHVLSRVELPFQRAALAENEVPEGRVVVQPRQNLWRIARHVYGHGVRYTVIYEANRDQIRNANLIYPGQVFLVPPAAGSAMPVTSTSSIQSR